MKINNFKILFMLLVFSLSCARSNHTEIYPLQENDYFSYEIIPKRSRVRGNTIKIYKIQKIDKDNFKVILITKLHNGINYLEYHDSLSTFICNKFGEIIDGEVKRRVEFERGKLIKLWLPLKNREIGETIDFQDSKKRNYLVVDKITWKNWEVWDIKVQNAPNSHIYYDVNSGFLVGSENSSSIVILIDTNKEI